MIKIVVVDYEEIAILWVFFFLKMPPNFELLDGTKIGKKVRRSSFLITSATNVAIIGELPNRFQ